MPILHYIISTAGQWQTIEGDNQMTFFDISRFHREEICDDEIDLMHEMDVKQSRSPPVLFPISNKQNYASSAGRTQSGATSPPFESDVNGPRQPKTERGPHFVMPSNLTKMDPDLALSPSKE